MTPPAAGSESRNEEHGTSHLGDASAPSVSSAAISFPRKNDRSQAERRSAGLHSSELDANFDVASRRPGSLPNADGQQRLSSYSSVAASRLPIAPDHHRLASPAPLPDEPDFRAPIAWFRPGENRPVGDARPMLSGLQVEETQVVTAKGERLPLRAGGWLRAIASAPEATPETREAPPRAPLLDVEAASLPRGENSPRLAAWPSRGLTPNQDSPRETLNPESRLQAAAGGLTGRALPPVGGDPADVHGELRPPTDGRASRP